MRCCRQGVASWMVCWGRAPPPPQQCTYVPACTDLCPTAVRWPAAQDCTCPMCRAEVKPPGLKSYGDGASSLLPQLF